MTNKLKLLPIFAMLLLTGCVNMGKQASFGEKMSDNFIFTSATSIPDSETKCVSLAKIFEFKTGSVTYTLPAGTYRATKKNSTGEFYYAPSSIESSTWLADSAYGIYINNQFTQANLFGTSPTGYDSRPIRGSVLPSTIFQYLRKNGHC